MPKTKKPPTVRLTVRRAVCDIYSTEPMTCFLCGERVPPKTPHHCEREEQPEGDR